MPLFTVTTTYTNGSKILEAVDNVEADDASVAQDAMCTQYEQLGYEVLGQFTRTPDSPGSAPADGYMVYHPLMEEAPGHNVG